MNKELKVNFLEKSTIKDKANEFLRTYHSNLILPIPIEDIVEFELDINIIPLPNLFSALDVDAFLSSDLKEITVDQGILEKVQSRYRFSLAHEVGHIVLHAQYYEGVSYSTTDEFKDFQNNIAQTEYDKLEWQAGFFARVLLVPTEKLIEQFNAGCELIARSGYKNIDDLRNAPTFPEYIANWITKKGGFDVSDRVIIHRLRDEGLIDQNYSY